MSVGKREYLSRLQTFTALFNFEWNSQNKVGNIGILVLWRDREKLHLGFWPHWHHWNEPRLGFTLPDMRPCFRYRLIYQRESQCNSLFWSSARIVRYNFILHLYIFIARKRSCGKVMFLHPFIILFTGGVYLWVRGVSPSGSRGECLPLGLGVYTPWEATLIGRHPQPWADTPSTLDRHPPRSPGRTPRPDTPCKDDHWSGPYASYWNAFLFVIFW